MPGTFPTTLRQCPVCKKADPFTPEAPHCPRCGSDLTKVAAAHAAARQHTIAAAASLRAGDYQDALGHADYAWSLARLPAIPPLACLAALHSRQLPDLALWRARL
jgi:predicted amidophosphoribosyltransferase